MGYPGSLEDVAQVRRMLIRVLREFPQVRLLIAGDVQVFQLFESLPEGRCLFLPLANAEDYPVALEQVDVLLAPLRGTPFNHSSSDQPLMEAGMRGIPWVASPIPAYQDWEAGGLIARTPDEWHTHLRQLVQDAELRGVLGAAGRQKAARREMSHLARIWLDMIQQTSSV
jgi:glycosyltransferase involved in cell wall biosynthesis